MKLDDNQPAAEKTTNSSAQNDIIDKLILCIVMQYLALQRFYILHWPKSLSLSLSRVFSNAMMPTVVVWLYAYVRLVAHTIGKAWLKSLKRHKPLIRTQYS